MFERKAPTTLEVCIWAALYGDDPCADTLLIERAVLAHAVGDCARVAIRARAAYAVAAVAANS